MARGNLAEPTVAMQEQQSRLAEQLFGPQLEMIGLAEAQIESQNLEELEASLERVNAAIAHPESFGVFQASMEAGFGIILTKAQGHFTIGALLILLQRKQLILDRIKAVRPQEQLASVREQVARIVVDDESRAQILRVIDERTLEDQKLTEKLNREEEITRAEERRAEAERRKVEYWARRSDIIKSLLERETVAGAIGPLLLLVLGLSLVIAMFTHTPISTPVSDSFLLILGYFFGNSTARRPVKAKKGPNLP